MNKILIAGMLVLCVIASSIAQEEGDAIEAIDARQWSLVKRAMQIVEYRSREKTITLVFKGFTTLKKVEIPMQEREIAKSDKNEPRKSWKEAVSEALKFAIEHKLIPDEIDCEDVLMCDGYLYCLTKDDKPLLMKYPRSKGEATETWLNRIVQIKNGLSNTLRSSSDSMSDDTSDYYSARSTYSDDSECSEVEPLLSSNDMHASSSGPRITVEAESVSLSEDDYVGIVQEQDDVPDNRRRHHRKAQELPKVAAVHKAADADSESKKSAKKQLAIFAQKYDKAEQSALVPSSMKWGLGGAALAAYAYFCYSKSKVIRTNK